MCDASDIGGIAGGVGGFMIGGPAGAAAGYGVGSSVGGMFEDSPEFPGGGRDYLASRRQEYDQWASQYLDENRYQEMANEKAAIASGRIGRTYASMGAVGGAMIGGQMEAERQVLNDMMNRRMSDRSAIAQTQMGFTTGISNIDMAEYNVQLKDQQAKQEMWGSLAQAGGMMAAYGSGAPGTTPTAPGVAAPPAGGYAPSYGGYMGQPSYPEQYYGSEYSPPETGGFNLNGGGF